MGRWHRMTTGTILLGIVLVLAACSGSEDPSGVEASGTWARIDPAQLGERLQNEDVFLVNVHVPYEGEISGTDAFIPFDEITSHLDELPSDTSTLVLYCRSGNMSTEAARELVADGITGFSELAGGFNAWVAEGRPFSVKAPTG